MRYSAQAFDDYLLQKMTPSEKRAFEEDLAADSELREAFEAYSNLVGAVREDGRQELRYRLTRMRLDWDKRLKRRSWIRRGAAVLIGLLAVSLFLYLSYTSKRSPPELFEAFYEPAELPDSIAGAAPFDPVWKDFVEAYQQGLFAEALQVLPVTILLEATEDPKVWMAYGCALIGVGDFSRAAQHFGSPTVAHNTFTADEAKWYQALCLLQLGQFEACANLLQVLAADPDADFHAQAGRLLKQVQRLR